MDYDRGKSDVYEGSGGGIALAHEEIPIGCVIVKTVNHWTWPQRTKGTTSGHACGGDGDWKPISMKRAGVWIRLFLWPLTCVVCEWEVLDSPGDLQGDQSEVRVERSLYDIWQMNVSTAGSKWESWSRMLEAIMQTFFRQVENEKNKWLAAKAETQNKNRTLPNRTNYDIIPIRQQFCVKRVRGRISSPKRSELCSFYYLDESSPKDVDRS